LPDTDKTAYRRECLIGGTEEGFLQADPAFISHEPINRLIRISFSDLPSGFFEEQDRNYRNCYNAKSREDGEGSR
jgi:hypothetical protein